MAPSISDMTAHSTCRLDAFILKRVISRAVTNWGEHVFVVSLEHTALPNPWGARLGRCGKGYAPLWHRFRCFYVLRYLHSALFLHRALSYLFLYYSQREPTGQAFYVKHNKTCGKQITHTAVLPRCALSLF